MLQRFVSFFASIAKRFICECCMILQRNWIEKWPMKKQILMKRSRSENRCSGVTIWHNTFFLIDMHALRIYYSKGLHRTVTLGPKKDLNWYSKAQFSLTHVPHEGVLNMWADVSSELRRVSSTGPGQSARYDRKTVEEATELRADVDEATTHLHGHCQTRDSQGSHCVDVTTYRYMYMIWQSLHTLGNGSCKSRYYLKLETAVLIHSIGT